MYSLMFAPVHAPNLSAPVFFNEKVIWYLSPPARSGIAAAVRRSIPSMIGGDSTTTHFCGFGALALASVAVVSARSVYGKTRRFAGTLSPLLSDAIASSLVE